MSNGKEVDRARTKTAFSDSYSTCSSPHWVKLESHPPLPKYEHKKERVRGREKLAAYAATGMADKNSLKERFK